MKILTKTTKEKGHYHIVYFNDETNTVLCSTANGHTHNISYNENYMPEYSNIVSDEEPLIIEEFDNHIHFLKAINEPKDTKINKEKVYSEVLIIGEELKKYENSSRERAKLNIKFEKGDQWDSAVKSHLNKQRRAALTINEIRPKINILTGYQAQNRSDIIFKPIEDGDQIAADVLSHIVKIILENNNYFFTETKMFRKSAVSGRSVLIGYIDFDKNIEGDIVIKEFPFDSVWYSPHSEVTLEDCEIEYREQMLSVSKAKMMFPDINIEEMTNSFSNDKNSILANVKGTKYDDISGGDTSQSFMNITGKRIKVVEVWRRVYERSDIIVNAKEDFVFNAGTLSNLDQDMIKEFEGFKIIPRISNKMRVTKVVGNKVVSDEILEDEMPFFQTFPLYCYKYDDGWDSIVTDALDPQREVNKRHSQLVDILNRHAAYGWIIDDQTFDKKEEERFKRNSSTAGFIAKVRQGGRLDKIEGSKFPNEIANLEQISSNKIKEVMNVNLEMQGMNSRAESGVAIIEKKKQGLIGNNFLFDNLTLLKKNIAKYIVYLIQKYYSVNRIMRILDTKASQEEVMINGKEYKNYDPSQVRSILENLNITKYDVAISESNYSDTLRRADFAAWLQYAASQPVPPQFLLELSDLPQKEKYKAYFEQQQQRQMEQERAKQQTEIQKTQIAQQNKNNINQ